MRDFDTASEAKYDSAKGVWIHHVVSPYLRGSNPVEVLLPSRYNPAYVYRTLYVLPTHPGVGGRWGDGLQELRKLGVHDAHDLICVSPSFDSWPYYGAHATDPHIRHEEYILETLLPLVESSYTADSEPEARLLLGFSKSGRGALSLLFRNPDVFGYAASWDAPLMINERNFGVFETAEHFGSRESMARYTLGVWAEKNAAFFADRTRLAVLGHNFFGTRWFRDLPHTWRFQWLLKRLGVRHVYDNSIQVAHTWNPGWMKPAVEILLRIADEDLAARGMEAYPRWDECQELRLG